MTIVPLSYAPGVCKVDSAYSNSVKGGSGRFTDMNLVRFVAGKPEAIGLASIMTTLGDTLLEVDMIVGIKDFRDNSGNIYVAYGNASHLYYMTLSSFTVNYSISMNASVDITPLRSTLTGNLTNPLDTLITSTTVTVHHTAHGLSTGDYVQLVTGTAVGGIQPSGVFAPITVSDANTYTIVNTSAATSTVNGGGGTVAYTYYRITIANPFDTVSGTKNVSVNHTAHGAVAGDYVTIAGASAVGGVTPSGEYKVQSVTNANKYVIQVSSNASSTVNGGGGTPNFRYNIATGASTATSTPPRVWSLDNYGQQLLACPYNGTIYIWDPTVGGRAYPMYNAPTGVLAMFVTPERFVFALGKTGNARIIQWPDQNDYTAWTPTATNTANSRTLQEGSYLVGGIVVRDGVSLVFSNTACYEFNYTGDNFIYSSQVAGRNCGLPGQMAVTVMEGAAYWFSGREFWSWNGSVQRLQSDDIRDYVVGDFYNDSLNQCQYLCVAGANSAKKEVWFCYTSASFLTNVVGAIQLFANSRYVIYHVDTPGCWSSGTAAFTSWRDSSLIPAPIVAAFPQALNVTYTGTVSILALDYGLLGGFSDFRSLITSSNSSLTFSPLDISSGGTNMDIFCFIPDFIAYVDVGGTTAPRTPIDMQITINTQNYPFDTISTYGPYSFETGTPIIQFRIGAKLIGYKIENTNTGDRFYSWRLGLPRVEAQPSGARL